MFRIKKRIAEMGVLGINRRNAEYTLRYNPRRLFPLVDDKLQTKKIALKAGIAVPELYEVVETEYQVRHIEALLKSYSEFAIKPSRGSGGEGILVISGCSKNMYRKVDGTLLNPEEVAYHLFNIISGIYSLGGQPDKVLIEYRVQFDPVFEAISYQGVPDIRVIVFLGVPVMSMVRLPTRMSGGKANLHQGALGAGIDITTGTTLTAVWRDNIVTEHPDTGNPVTGVQIASWDTLLHIASRCYELIGLGYIGVDLVLDKDKGPLILELNARPGLNIQIANRSGLLPRLKLVEQHHHNLTAIEERVAFSKKHFSATT
ncbi:MAG: alpha-L-glutamate ligase-like protein [Desulfobacterales bacterium]|jgi:alpha-L-glutamate ligase-like protein